MQSRGVCRRNSTSGLRNYPPKRVTCGIFGSTLFYFICIKIPRFDIEAVGEVAIEGCFAIEGCCPQEFHKWPKKLPAEAGNLWNFWKYIILFYLH